MLYHFATIPQQPNSYLPSKITKALRINPTHMPANQQPITQDTPMCVLILAFPSPLTIRERIKKSVLLIALVDLWGFSHLLSVRLERRTWFCEEVLSETRSIQLTPCDGTDFYEQNAVISHTESTHQITFHCYVTMLLNRSYSGREG